MTEKFFSPRWLHQSVEIGATSHRPVPSAFFANNEVWNWHLVYLAIVGTAALDEAGNYSHALGGVARRLRLNIGMSQMGDINVVPSNGHAMFGPNESYLVHSNDLNIGAALRFDPKYPYQLPPDTGIAARVRNDNLTYNIDNLGCLFMGFDEPAGFGEGPRNPVHIGARAIEELQPGGDFTFDDADLFNDGEHPATLTDMVLQGFALNEQNVSNNTWDQVSWLLNPSTGPEWMPNDQPIPVGCLCPFNRGILDANDVGPRAYVFPEETIMKPRQRISIEAFNYSASEQIFEVCLFGYLEVA